MTKLFDDKSRSREINASEFFEEPTIAEDTKVSDMVVTRSTTKKVRGYIAAYHYSKVMPDNGIDVFVGYYDKILAGICVFNNGVSVAQFTRIIPELQDGEYRELTRLWSPDGMPKNTESKLIAESIKQLPKKVKLLISYADSAQGHLGVIYQATNWLYTGMTSAGDRLVDEKGRNFHVKTIDTFRKRHPELKNLPSKEIMKKYGWKAVPGSEKHRYIKILGTSKYKRKIIKQLTILPYPK